MQTILATIELDGGGIGQIYAGLEPSAYYEDEGIYEAYRIYVRDYVFSPNGSVQDADIAPCRTRDDALKAIETAWSLPTWHLTWDDAAVERWVGI